MTRERERERERFQNSIKYISTFSAFGSVKSDTERGKTSDLS